MELSTITVNDFKALFFRDFFYLPIWSASTVYNTDNKIYYETNGLFYKCLSDSVVAFLPTNATYWLKYSDNIYNYILDADIEKAFSEAVAVFNQGLFSDDDSLKLAYLYLTAHFLVLDIKTSLQGINGNSQYPVSSRSVGSVSESYAIPQAYLDSPVLSYFSKTNYGLKYLSMVQPNLMGNIVAVEGWTTP